MGVHIGSRPVWLVRAGDSLQVITLSVARLYLPRPLPLSASLPLPFSLPPSLCLVRAGDSLQVTSWPAVGTRSVMYEGFVPPEIGVVRDQVCTA